MQRRRYQNFENNNIIGDLFSIRKGRVAVTGSMALDDFDVFDRFEPESLALTRDLTISSDRADLGRAPTAITARADDTGLHEQSYLCGERGLGTQFGDSLHVRTIADVYLDDVVSGLTLHKSLIC